MRSGRLAGVLGKGRGAAARALSEQHEADLTAVRQATWTRSVNVVVASPKGGVGRTTATLLLAGTLGQVRGGYVAALEVTEDQGDLSDRAEGMPARGVTDLLADPHAADTAGSMGAFTAPQSSHFDVIASTGPRAELTEEDVVLLRSMVDRHYRITVTDTGANQHSQAFQAAASGADAVLVPVMCTPSAVAAVSRTLMHLSELRRADLLGRVTVVVAHDGGWEDKQVTASVPAQLAALGVRHVVDIPFDQHLRRGEEITLASLSAEARRAWVRAAAAVVDCLQEAHPAPAVLRPVTAP